MGLDMYLTKKTYIAAQYEHNNVTGTIDIQKHGKPVKIDFKRISEISESVGYWRKANQIHNWFVENVQEGEDDCKEYDVSKDDLQKLLGECKAVMAGKDKAQALLKTTGGFFFGGTDYSDYYFEQIQATIKIIEEALNEVDEEGNLTGDYYYQASW